MRSPEDFICVRQLSGGFFPGFDQHYSTTMYSMQAKHFKTARKAYKERRKIK